MNNYSFEVITPSEFDWKEIESSFDCTVFHTKKWDEYLSLVGRKHIVVRVRSNQQIVGFFIGTKRWAGINVIGSPDGGTGTYVQGLCMKNRTSIEERMAIYEKLVKFFMTKHIAGYIQISDWQLMSRYEDYQPDNQWTMPILDQLGIHYTLRSTFIVDTRIEEGQLWANLKYKSCKYPINRARKMGLWVKCIENKEEIPVFIDTLSEQISDVSRRKGERRHVHHKKNYLTALCNSLFPDHVLMLQVRGVLDDGVEHVMSSAVFCIGKTASTYFSGASNEVFMKYCPNELMVWEAIRILHERGAGDLIFGGTASYKKKFGSSYAYLPMMVFSKYSFLFNLRVTIKKAYKRLRSVSLKPQHR